MLLLDEPLGVLGKKLREQMQIELRALQQQVGITFAFVTHDQEEALTLSDRIAVMSKGDILEIESPARLYESPRTHFVADFIGTMNFFNGSIRHIENGCATITSDLLGEVRPAAADTAMDPGSEVVAIRPEKLQLVFERPEEHVNVVEVAWDRLPIWATAATFTSISHIAQSQYP